MQLMETSTAWAGIVLSVFAVVILGTLAGLYSSGHETFVGSINDPPPEAVSGLVRNMVIAVIAYGVFIVICFGQIALNKRARGRGEIAL